MWEVELIGLHQVLSAVRDLVDVLGNGAPLYVVPAQWRNGSPPSLKDHPATELLTAGGEIIKAHSEFHDQLMLLTKARHRIGRITLQHDQLSIWSKKL